jgi:hypothetical protein
MIGTVTLLVIGFVLVGLLIFLLRRSEPMPDGTSRPRDGSQSAGPPPFEVSREEVLDRIFGAGDWDFIQDDAPKGVRRLFLAERKKLAFCWLAEIRGLTKSAMHFHVASARSSRDLQTTLELGLLFDYLTLQVECGLISVAVLLRGPMALRSMVARVLHLSDKARELVDVASRTDVPRVRVN